MTKFYKYEAGLFEATKEELDKLVFYTSKEILNEVGTFKIRNNFYKWSTARNFENNKNLGYEYIGVREINIDFEKKEEEYTNYITCPVCGKEENDSLEYEEDEGEYECGCGAILSYVRQITIDYSTEVKEMPKILKI